MSTIEVIIDVVDQTADDSRLEIAKTVLCIKIFMVTFALFYIMMNLACMVLGIPYGLMWFLFFVLFYVAVPAFLVCMMLSRRLN